MAEKKGQAPDWLVAHFDKMILGAVVLIGAVYLYLGVIAAEPPASISQAVSEIDRVEAELTRPHPGSKPESMKDLAARTESAWRNEVGGFEAKEWTSSFMTHLTVDEIRSEDYEKRLRRKNTRWVLPEIEIQPPQVEIDRVIVKWTMVKPEKTSWTEGGPELEKKLFFEMNQYRNFVLERRVGGEKNPWKKVKSVTEFDAADYEQNFTYEDKDIQPKTVYAYRVRGEAKAQTMGEIKVKSRQTKAMTARTKGVWRVRLKWILPPVGEREDPLAVVEVMKFDLEKGKWFGPKEFRHTDQDPHNEIGVEAEINRDGSVDRKFVFKTRDPDTGESVEIDWRTGFTIKAIEKDLTRQFKRRKVDKDGNPILDENGDPVMMDPVRRKTDRVTYLDDEGNEVHVWSRDPNEVIDVQDKPRQPKKEEKKDPGGN